MKLKALLFTTFATLTLTACTTTPKIPELQTGALQEINNLDIHPTATKSKATLIKFADRCSIEYTASSPTGKIAEQWAFKGNTVFSGGGAVFAPDGTSKAAHYDLTKQETLDKFTVLKNKFAKDALEQCE